MFDYFNMVGVLVQIGVAPFYFFKEGQWNLLIKPGLHVFLLKEDPHVLKFVGYFWHLYFFFVGKNIFFDLKLNEPMQALYCIISIFIYDYKKITISWLLRMIFGQTPNFWHRKYIVGYSPYIVGFSS